MDMAQALPPKFIPLESTGPGLGPPQNIPPKARAQPRPSPPPQGLARAPPNPPALPSLPFLGALVFSFQGMFQGFLNTAE